MRPNFDYANVPISFSHCFNRECTMADQCMRSQLTKLIPDSRESVPIVNPSLTNADGKDCRYYEKDETVRFALGMKHMFDKLEYTTAKAVKKEVIGYFSETTFYRDNRKGNYITPEEQAAVRRIFRRYGITTEPMYDEYIEKYAWEKKLIKR